MVRRSIEQKNSTSNPNDSPKTGLTTRLRDGDTTSKTSWLKSKTKKIFSLASHSKSTTEAKGIAAADGDDSKVSQDKTAIRQPLAGGSSQPVAGESIVEVNVRELLSRPIAELWDEAYEELCKREKSLVADYNAQLSNSLGKAVGSTGEVLAMGFPGLWKLQKFQEMEFLLKRKTKNIEDGIWKLKFQVYEFAVKDLVGPILSAITWAKDFIGASLETSPYGSIAWAGVCVLLPLFLNPSKQEAARVKDLEIIASIISRCNMREDLYRQRYESINHSESKEEFIRLHSTYRDSLRTLYMKILRFQATGISFLSQNYIKRAISDMVMWNDWDKMLAEIKEEENELKSIEEQWRDMKYEEEFQLQTSRHKERMRGLSAIESEIFGVRRAVEQAQKEGERKQLLNWLSSVDPSTNYNSARRSHALSTGDWLVKRSSHFRDWENTPNSLLWLHGKAGAGKSFLSSSVIHHLKKLYKPDPYTVLAYFYFSFSDREKQNVENMVQSLIVQLCGLRPDTPQPLLDLRRYRDVSHQPDLESLENVLKASTLGFKRVYLVIDALDECPLVDHERDKVLKVLGHIREWNLTNLHVLCTSRPEPDIEAFLEPFFLASTTTKIDLQKRREEVNQDIRTYIYQRIGSSDFRSWPSNVKEEVATTLTQKSDGMFQYVALQLKALEAAKSSMAVMQALKDLPAGLDETYNRALSNIDQRHHAQAIRSLMWLAYSVRPLTVRELAEASIIDPKASPAVDKDLRLFNPLDVLSFLPGLVTVVDDDDNAYRASPWNGDEGSIVFREQGQKCNFIRLAHVSIKDFLLSDRIKSGPASLFSIEKDGAHIHIAESCLLYHLHISEVECQMHSVETLLKNFSLWDYAAKAWIEHAEATSQTMPQSLLDLIIRALKLRTEPLLNMIQIWLESVLQEKYDIGLLEGIPSTLYYTAYLGYLQSLSPNLKLELEDINANGVAFSTAGNSPYQNNHETFIRLLREALGCKPYDHLFEPIAVFRLSQGYLWTNPYPNSSLRGYWNRWPIPNFDSKTVLWSLKQMTGIANALHLIHNSQHTFPLTTDRNIRVDEESYWCHGDIKADQTLWFEDDSDSTVGSGILKIAYFGLIRFYSLHSRSKRSGGGSSYEAPESYFRSLFSPASDIWSLGCLYLEFITWLLEGSEKINDFANHRGQDINDVINVDFFFTIIEDGTDRRKAEVSKQVTEWTDLLCKNQNCSAVICDLIDVVMDKMLVVDASERIEAGSLEQYLNTLLSKGESDSKYLLCPIPYVNS